VILPDASVVVIGGGNTTGAVLTTAVLSNGSWTQLPSPSGDSPSPRIYHATAVLLPDGRVFVGGGEGHAGPGIVGTDYDVFVPHYLQPASDGSHRWRPEILSFTLNGTVIQRDPIPDGPNGTWNLTKGTQVVVETTKSDVGTDFLAKVVLMAPGAMTHHSDHSARFVELTSSAVSGSSGQLLVQIPSATPGNDVLPRGYYMLFAIGSNGVPSVAKWVKIQ
jgi:hypothetical protein